MTTPTTMTADTAARIDAGLDRLEHRLAGLQTMVTQLGELLIDRFGTDGVSFDIVDGQLVAKAAGARDGR